MGKDGLKLNLQRVSYHVNDGVQLVGEAWGASDAAPVLLLHGGGQTRHAWGGTAGALAEQGWYAVALDLRGHGDSSWSPDGNYQIDTFVEDLRRVLLHFKQRPILVGASLGGMTALLTAGEVPQPVSTAVVLVDITPRVEQKGVERIRAFMTARPEGFASLEEAADTIAEYLPHRPRPKDLSGLQKNLRLSADGRYHWHWDPQLISPERFARRRDPERLLAAARSLRVPTMLVRGGISDVVSEETTKEFLAAVPHAKYVDVAGAGHMVAGDRNDAFSKAVIEFLTEVKPLLQLGQTGSQRELVRSSPLTIAEPQNRSNHMEEGTSMEKSTGVPEPQTIGAFSALRQPPNPQEYYDRVKQKFAAERDLRLQYRPEGTAQYTSDLTGALAKYEIDPYAPKITPRAPLTDTVECLFIGGGFSALLTSARLREYSVESIRIVERGADVGGTWYWNRYPGVACDVPSYDYLPLLDELDYVPKHRYAKGPEIYAHCQAIARKYNLYDLAVFQTTVTATVWDEAAQMWHITTDRGDHMKARFVICANGTLAKPKLSKITGMESFQGHSFHSSRWDYAYTQEDLSGLADKVVGIIGTGASAVQIIPRLGAAAKELYVFQRTPSSIDLRNDWPTDPNWARRLQPGWQAKRRERALMGSQLTEEQKAELAFLSREEKIRRQENANIEYMMRIHRRVDEIVKDKATAEALKPWYMFMCKRPCFDDEYLPAYNRPNVHLVDTKGKGITEITEKGPLFEGKQYELDVLIYATGFEVQKTGIYNQIKGERGLDLNDKYRDGIRTLYGIHSQGYPNLFIMGGYQASFQFNLTDMLQTQGDHIAACIDYVRRHGYQTMDVTPEAEEWWVQEVIRHRGKTTRNQDCTPGYYNFEGEFNRRQDGNYNGGFLRYYTYMKEAREKMGEQFVFTTK